jgi:hypothetical protein
MATFVDAETEWGITAANSAAVNATQIQAMEDQLSFDANNDGVWRTVRFPRGVIQFSASIIKHNYVNWVGCGVDSTKLRFTGNNGAALAISGTRGNGASPPVQAPNARLSIANLTLESTGTSAKGITITRAARAFELLSNIQIFGFKDSGLSIGNDVSDCSFRDLEIVSCGTGVAGGSGLKREATAIVTAALTFENLKVEGCGQNVAGGRGGIDWASGFTGGLYFTGMTRIQSNFGDFEAFIAGTNVFPAGVDALSFDDLYIETRNGNRDGLRLTFCQAAITGKARFGGTSNQKAIVLSNTDLWIATHPTVTNTYVSSVDLKSGSFLFRPTPITQYPLIITKDTSSEDMVNVWPHGIFDGKTGGTATFVSGRNYTVTRSALGSYNVLFKRALPNALYTVTVTVADGVAPKFAVVSAQTATGFTIKVFAVNGTTANDASSIRFIVQG